MSSDVLETARLVLRPPIVSDGDQVVALLNNWNVASMLARAPHPYGPADFDVFVERARQRPMTVDDVVYAICMNDSVAGVVSVLPASRGPNLGYWLGEPYWGRGVMTEAVAAVVKAFYNVPNTDHLCSGIFRGNDASLAIQKKFGFEVVGQHTVMCAARGHEMPHVDTLLTRRRYEEASL